MPAGRWWLAWYWHQGMQGGVCREWRGVNWVSAGCKTFQVKAWYSSSWCSVSHTLPRRYRWWGGKREKTGRSSFTVCSTKCLCQERVLLSFTVIGQPPLFFSAKQKSLDSISTIMAEQELKVQSWNKKALTTNTRVYATISNLSTWRWWNLKV